MRAIKTTYTQLCEYIQANVLDLNNEPVFKWVDLWNEQTEFENKEYSFNTPALFIDFNAVQVEQGGLWQDATTMEITFYVVHESMADTFHTADNQDTALYFLEILSLLHEQLQGHAHAPFSALTRVRMGRYPTASLQNVYSCTYKTMIVDYSPTDVRKPLVPTEIDAELNVVKYNVEL